MRGFESNEDVPPPGRIGRIAVGDLIRRTARRLPQRIALAEGDRRTTYAELDALSNRFADHLLRLDLGAGARVATICNNSTEFVIALFGILKAGLVWVPVNTVLTPRDARYIVEHSGVRAVVVDSAIYARPEWREIVDGLGAELILNDPAAQPAFAAILRDASSEEPQVEIGERDLAIIMYTSGTTAMPKGAMHCHLAITIAAMSNAVEWRLDREDAVTGLLPLFHCAQHTLLNAAFLVGAKVVVAQGFEPRAFLETATAEKITISVLLPAMYDALLDHPARAAHPADSLRLCIWGMAPMSKTLVQRITSELCPNLILGSGQTEMYPTTTMTRPDRALARFGNYWGESAVMNETAIMDDEGRLLPPGETGEIVHRGPNVMMGYYRDPAATAAARAHGWHHTGDLGRIDDHGELLFVDRKKDLIKSGGENVSSVKVEEALLAHPAVARAAAVGLPHPRWGECVTAFVCLKPGAQASEDEILAHGRNVLSGFQAPKAVVILPEMPMVASGKVKKAELRQAYAGRFASETAI